MAGSRTRTVGLGVLVLVLAAVVGSAAGVAAYSRVRTDTVGREATSVRIDGVAHDCGPHRAVGVSIALVGPGEARFAVDGAEVPADRAVVAGTGRVETSALLPVPARFPRCDDGTAHRYTVLTSSPQGCRWTVTSQQTQEEARGHQWALQESGTGCSLVLD